VRTLTCALVSLLLGLGPARASALDTTGTGHLKLLTYNVAGLPEGLSQSHPSVNLPLISKLLNRYDIVLVQEDFSYPALLRRSITHAFISPPSTQPSLGDGLSEFSRLRFADFQRETWTACHGFIDSYNDCLAPKGFSYARHEFAPGVFVDIYDVHLDAGGGPGDRQARESQIAQLTLAIAKHSAGQAVIVGGDTNIRRGQSDLLQRFENDTGLSDACAAAHCAEPARIDRFFFRSSRTLTLTAKSVAIDSRFVDARGQALSDHFAVAAEFDWQRLAPAAN
jgi:hypothetical protein